MRPARRSRSSTKSQAGASERAEAHGGRPELGTGIASDLPIELSPTSRHHERRAGFTIIELMVVVTIIGIIAGLAGPTITTGIREMRASGARADVVRILNHARAASRGMGKAHLLEFNGASDGNRGRLALYRSNGSSCLTTGWQAIMARSNNCDLYLQPGVGDDCIARTELQAFFEWSGLYALQLTEATNTLLYVCYEPAGRTLWSNQGGAAGLTATPPPAANGAFLFTLTTSRGVVGGPAIGVARRIIQPYGSTARVRQ
jgi:prepilin-type N-terminal cleavage/methylation domain-containing protein